MITRSIRWLIILTAVIMLAGVGTAQAQEWWNEQWQFRRKLSFDASPTGADVKSNLAELPVLVRLHTGNFNFANCSDSGEDIRFVSADDKSLLKHHIEKFDPIDEIGYIWVRMPKLSGGAVQDFIWMYYGNRNAVGGQDSAGTFEAGHAAVFHLAELEGAPKDASAYNNHVGRFQGGQGLPSVIGNGVTLSGAGDHLVIPASPSLDFTKGFTFSAWLRIQQDQDNAMVFARQSVEGEGIFIFIEGTRACFKIVAADGQTYRTQECMDLSLGSWHHIAFTAASKGRMSTYLDGLELFYINLSATLPKLEGDLFIGESPDGGSSFVGDLDEIRISNLARSYDWLRASFKSQGPDNLLAQVGVEEIGGGSGLPVFYLATVMKNITLDGWMVIGCLAVLGMASWVVFASKAAMLYAVEKENKAFKSTYQEMPDPVAFQNNGEEYDQSTLYRVFASGYDALKRCLEKNGNGVKASGLNDNKSKNGDHSAQPNENLVTADINESKPLDSRATKTIKAALEKGFIEESERLNAWLVILTMGISGGPFLGLLGTVWGVMNTFAAMAEAGEANIMAIAPGVASALSTTVIGLIVAIPALFGYNYLTGKIKSITAEMMIIVDQLSVNIEEIYGASK